MAHSIKALLPFVGEKPIDRLHNDTLVPFIEARRRAELATGTINKDLSVVRRILNLAARVWRDESGLSWLSAPPLIQMLKGPRRRPYPLSWDEQTLLFKEAAGLLGAHVPVQSERGASRARGLPVTVGLGDPRAGARDERVRDSGFRAQER
jgi:hypothetical protein